MRYKLTIEYDGTPFHGWQIQDNLATVQGCISDAIQKFTNAYVSVNGAGRTDSGVHANAQVAHIDLDDKWNEHTILNAINYHLRPNPITIIKVEKTDGDFDARFSAIKRYYIYKIINRNGHLSLKKNRALHVPRKLNTENMQKATKLFIGKHDFTAFRSAHCQSKSPIKTLDSASIEIKEDEINIHFNAKSFLHRQVRSMVGTLLKIGENDWPIDKISEILKSQDRSQCGPVAGAHGLYLDKIDYPKESE
jgi:tRNA pseudouridine38-40 synthase